MEKNFVSWKFDDCWFLLLFNLKLELRFCLQANEINDNDVWNISFLMNSAFQNYIDWELITEVPLLNTICSKEYQINKTFLVPFYNCGCKQH